MHIERYYITTKIIAIMLKLIVINNKHSPVKRDSSIFPVVFDYNSAKVVSQLHVQFHLSIFCWKHNTG